MMTNNGKVLRLTTVLCLVVFGNCLWANDFSPILESFEKLADDALTFEKLQANSRIAHHGHGEITSERTINETWLIFNETELEDFFNDLVNVSLELLALEYKSMSRCSRDLAYTILHINKNWAIQMLDADAKIPSGIMEGNFIWPGSYSVCKDVVAPPLPNLLPGFRGRHCMQSWILSIKNQKLPISTGVCVPDSCHESDLKEKSNLKYILARGLSALPKTISLKLNLTLELQSVSCQPMKKELDSPAIGMLCLLGFFIVLLVSGTSITIYDNYTAKYKVIQDEKTEATAASNNGVYKLEYSNGEPINAEIYLKHQDYVIKHDDDSRKVWNTALFLKKFLLCFCVLTNGAKILSTKNTKGQMLCINGIRFLSMSWVILGHTFAFAVMGKIANVKEVLTLIDNWEFQVILQGTYSVDSFFLMSGFLLTYLFFKEMTAKKGDISWAQFYLHRYWRLTPVYAIILFYDVAIQKYVSEGPFWVAEHHDPACENGGWSWNLLYFNNFDDDGQCMGWSWYLSNDMQFYVISPIFLYPLWRWPRVGFSIVAALLVGTWVSAMVFTYHFNLVPGYVTLIQNAGQSADYMIRVQDYFNKIYIKPYNRIAPYLIGVILGYILWQKRDQKKFLSLPAQVIGWLFAAFFGLSMVYGFYHSDPTLLVSSLYNAFSRSLFSLALAWVIFACITEHGGVVNSILSYELFIPLGRLTYCAYLVHPLIILGYYQSMHSVLMFSHITMVTLFFGFLLMSYGTALITSIAFESPLMALEKIKKS